MSIDRITTTNNIITMVKTTRQKTCNATATNGWEHHNLPQQHNPPLTWCHPDECRIVCPQPLSVKQPQQDQFVAQQAGDVGEHLETEVLQYRLAQTVGRHTLGGVHAHLTRLAPQTHLKNGRSQT